MDILNRHHFKNRPLPPGAVYVGRGTPLGNPFAIGEHGTREEVIDRYQAWLCERIAVRDPVALTALAGLRSATALVCSCAPARCHAECIRDAVQELETIGGLGALREQRELCGHDNTHPLIGETPAKRTYAGIGARATPPEMLHRLTRIAERLHARGYRLRSGAAEGADTAFEAGAGDDAEIFLPQPGFRGHDSRLNQPSSEAIQIAELLHPNPRALSVGALKLMARNSHQVLGADLRSPVDFVVCWTPDGAESEAERRRETGGTGQAIALADRWGIPVFNLARPDALERLGQHIRATNSPGSSSY